MISRFRLLSLFALLLFVSVMAACGEEEVRKFAQGTNGGASGISVGIDTVRALREADEIDAPKALELARGALDVNTIMGEAVEFTLKQGAIDEPGRQKLHAQYSDISERARRLIQNGTIRIRNDRVRLAFTLGTIAGQAALDVAVDDLARTLPDGVTIPVDDETRRTLEAAREKIKRNDARLREAIDRLERLIQVSDFGGAGSGGAVVEQSEVEAIPLPSHGSSAADRFELTGIPLRHMGGSVGAIRLNRLPEPIPTPAVERVVISHR